MLTFVCAFLVLWASIFLLRKRSQSRHLGGINIPGPHRAWSLVVDALYSLVWLCLAVDVCGYDQIGPFARMQLSLAWYFACYSIWGIGSVCCTSAYVLITAHAKRDREMVSSTLITTAFALLYMSSSLGTIHLCFVATYSHYAIYYVMSLCAVALAAQVVLFLRLLPVVKIIAGKYMN